MNESTRLISGALNAASAFGHTGKAQPAKGLISNISAQTLGALSVAGGEFVGLVIPSVGFWKTGYKTSRAFRPAKPPAICPPLKIRSQVPVSDSPSRMISLRAGEGRSRYRLWIVRQLTWRSSPIYRRRVSSRSGQSQRLACFARLG